MIKPSGPVVDLACARFGEPNWTLSTNRELRFGNKGSVSVHLETGAWFDHEADTGGYVENMEPKAEAIWPRMIVAKYDYQDMLGNLAYQVVRYMPKDFRQRQPDPDHPGRWIWKGAKQALPYRLPGLIAAGDDECVLLCEGEKDADILTEIGYVATTKSGGSGGWKSELTSWFKDKHVYVLPDNDDAGKKTARSSATALSAVAASVRIVDVCAGMAPKSDVSDYLATHERIDLQQVLDAAPLFKADELVTNVDVFETIDAGKMQAAIAADDFIEDLLIAGQMSVVYGPSGCGKTFFAADLAMHVAHGKAWRGRSVTQGGVLYIAAEGAYGIRNRIVAFQNTFGGEDPPLAVLPSNVNLFDSEEDMERLLSTMRVKAQDYGGLSLIVVDTLARALAGGNENSNEDMGAVIHNCDRIRRETGAHVMLVHHTGKDEARGARGHSSLRAATDTEVEISRSDPGAVARVTKQRELEMTGEFCFELDTVELGVSERGKPITSCVVRPVEIEMGSARKIRRPRGANQKVVWKVLRKLKADKKMVQLPYPLQGWGMGVDDVFYQVKEKFICDAKHKRERFERAVEGLQGEDFIGHESGWIWLII